MDIICLKIAELTTQSSLKIDWFMNETLTCVKNLCYVYIFFKVMSRVFCPSLGSVFVIHFVVTVLIASFALASEPSLTRSELIHNRARLCILI